MMMMTTKMTTTRVCTCALVEKIMNCGLHFFLIKIAEEEEEDEEEEDEGEKGKLDLEFERLLHPY